MLQEIARQIMASEAPAHQRAMLQGFLGLVTGKLTTLPDLDLEELVTVIYRRSGDLFDLIPCEHDPRQVNGETQCGKCGVTL